MNLHAMKIYVIPPRNYEYITFPDVIEHPSYIALISKYLMFSLLKEWSIWMPDTKTFYVFSTQWIENLSAQVEK